jgi:hypothetical protein
MDDGWDFALTLLIVLHSAGFIVGCWVFYEGSIFIGLFFIIFNAVFVFARTIQLIKSVKVQHGQKD